MLIGLVQYGLDSVYTVGTTKDIVVFLFVGINGMIFLPVLADSCYKFKKKQIGKELLTKRAIVLIIPLLIALILEMIFLSDIQVAVRNSELQDTLYMYDTTVTDDTEEIDADTENETTNETTNEISDEIISEELTVVVNGVSANTISNTTDSNSVSANTNAITD